MSIVIRRLPSSAVHWAYGLASIITASVLPAQAQDAVATAEPEVTAVSAVTVALPDVDPDAYFDGANGGTFGKKAAEVMGNSKRVAVAGFRVVFVTDSEVKAQVRGSYLPGRDTTGASAKMDMTLQGVDAATLQKLTDEAYATLLAQLAAAGREVVPVSEMQAMFAELEATPTSAAAPYTKTVSLGYGKRTGVAYSPSGMPLWWQAAEPWGDKSPFGQANNKVAAKYSEQFHAFIVAPVVVVDFAQLQTSGNQSGLIAREASVGAELGVSVVEFNTTYYRSDETRNGLLMKGDLGNLMLKQPVESALAFAAMEQIETKKTTGLMARMTGSAKSKSSNAAVTDDARYGAAATEALTLATGTFAKFFQKHS